MIKFFSNYRIIFYSLNIFLITLYLFPGSLVGWFIYGNKKIQPQITPDFIISSNHFYVFILISAIGFLSFKNQNQFKNLIIYLVLLSLILEIFHLFIPERSFQLSDLFGNFLGVIVVIFVRKLINKYGVSKK
jgi:VanZ family protein|tara:strand:+ start:267 stop:662 length:396 start_codon:yes stop_codon:yes gene_type:complete